MVFLRALINTARMIRHTPGLAAGLTPDDEVLLDAPDERLAPALAAAGRGDHRPAAALLAATREAAEWESRDRYSTSLAVFAQSRPGWFTDWRAAAPRDPDAALLRAELAVRSAWERPARAEALRETVPLVEAAAAACPRDPVPWRIALDQARGVRAGRADFDLLWKEAVLRSPHHYGCHVAALRWYGSFGERFAFAERAAEQALPGSLLHALPVRAAFEAPDGDSPVPEERLDALPGERFGPLADVRIGAVPDERIAGVAEEPVDAVSEERIDAAADRAVALSARYEPGDPWPAEVRNLLAHVLITRGRWADALEQFRLIGPRATAFPWSRISDDPLGQFLELRDGVRIQLASTMPLWRRPGSSPGQDH
ncbi:hypothetical protein [Streptomyces sp. 8N706]|uniref:hypothetical protein n=1 Tax=Streptomyces sp. 8N706 TaxID=3457416 RepID=UPI003FD4D2E7